MRSSSSPRGESPRFRLSGGLLVGGLCFVCLACAIADDGNTNFRDDVLLCEEAVARLQDCCPGVGQVYPEACEYREDGCNTGREVALNLRTSRCIRSKECIDLVESGTCERAREVVENGPVDASTRGEICTP